MLRSLMMTSMLLGLAAAAGAQETRASAERTTPDMNRPAAGEPCPVVDGLALCAPRVGAARAHLRPPKDRQSHFTRFTRLAGMFMGRVDAADLGPLKVRFNLELR